MKITIVAFETKSKHRYQAWGDNEPLFQDIIACGGRSWWALVASSMAMTVWDSFKTLRFSSLSSGVGGGVMPLSLLWFMVAAKIMA